MYNNFAAKLILRRNNRDRFYRIIAIGLCYTANAQTSKEELQQAKIDSLTTVIQDLRTNQQNIQKQIETVDKNATVWKRGKYRNFSFSKEKLEIDGFDAAIKSEWGAAITLGKTFYLHKTPILNMLILVLTGPISILVLPDMK